MSTASQMILPLVALVRIRLQPRNKICYLCTPFDAVLERGYLRREVFSHGVRHVLNLRNLVQRGVHLRPEQVDQLLEYRLSASFPRTRTMGTGRRATTDG